MMVELSAYVPFDPEEVGVTELVYYPALASILEEAGTDEESLKAVSYTHLDVYKRQAWACPPGN